MTALASASATRFRTSDPAPLSKKALALPVASASARGNSALMADMSSSEGTKGLQTLLKGHKGFTRFSNDEQESFCSETQGLDARDVNGSYAKDSFDVLH